MKTLPFNLERALAGDKVITVSGIPVPQLALFELPDTHYVLYAVVGGYSGLLSYTKYGEYHYNETCQLDLRMVATTQVINGIECPLPVSETPKLGENYLYISTGSPDYVGSSYWQNDFIDKHRLEKGLIFKTESDVRTVAEALLSYNKG